MVLILKDDKIRSKQTDVKKEIKNLETLSKNRSVSANQKLTIKIDEIIEKEINTLSKNMQKSDKFANDIKLLSYQWTDFCKTYRKIKRASKENDKNIATQNNKSAKRLHKI